MGVLSDSYFIIFKFFFIWIFIVSLWVWVNSGSWWWTGRPGVLRFMGSQRIGHNWATELNWTVLFIMFSAGGEAKEEYKREIYRRRKQKLKKKVTRETMRRQWVKPGEQEGRGEGRRHRAAGEGGQFNGDLANAAGPLLYKLPTLVYCSSSLSLHI